MNARDALKKSREDFAKRLEQHRSDNHPTPLELVSNFSGAVARWLASGFAVVTKEQYEARAAICDGCPAWNREAMAGRGRCDVCGCLSVKRWLATERCPRGKWPTLTPTDGAL